MNVVTIHHLLHVQHIPSGTSSMGNTLLSIPLAVAARRSYRHVASDLSSPACQTGLASSSHRLLVGQVRLRAKRAAVGHGVQGGAKLFQGIHL